jgi:exosortase
MSSSMRNRVLLFIALCAASVLFWWYPLVATFQLALAHDAYTHLFLILPLSVALGYLSWKRVRGRHAIQVSPGFRPGGLLLALAFLGACYARWKMLAAPGEPPNDERLSLAMFTLVVWWIASIVTCFGRRTLRPFLFPLTFLFLLVPIPQSALRLVIEFLQYQSAFAARVFFRMAGIPATQDGVMISIPGLDIEVAHECSSIRSSMILLVITLVFAQVFLRSWWRKALLLVAAIPLSVAKNGLRIFTIGDLGTRVDPAFLTGRLHHNGGIIFLAISVVWMMLLLWLLRRSELLSPPRGSY